jgi:hypothetical protein
MFQVINAFGILTSELYLCYFVLSLALKSCILIFFLAIFKFARILFGDSLMEIDEAICFKYHRIFIVFGDSLMEIDEAICFKYHTIFIVIVFILSPVY